VTRVDRGQLAVGAATEEGDHSLARADDLAGALETRNVHRRTRRRRVVARDLHQVGTVDARSTDADQQLAFGRHRIGPLRELEPTLMGDRRAHVA